MGLTGTTEGTGSGEEVVGGERVEDHGKEDSGEEDVDEGGDEASGTGTPAVTVEGTSNCLVKGVSGKVNVTVKGVAVIVEEIVNGLLKVFVFSFFSSMSVSV
jgi:hypothetical protein